MTCIVLLDTHARGAHSLRMHANDGERTTDVANQAAKHADEFRRGAADCIVLTGGPVTECCRELGFR